MAKLSFSEEKCKGCYYCMIYCPVGAIDVSTGSNKKGHRIVSIDSAKCIACGNCYRMCPDFCFEVFAGE